MPALSVLPSAVFGSLIEQNITNTSPPVLTANGTSETIEVICAWPVSGQYGPGSRILYYVLVAACVLGRGSAWLRSACLAAALLLPAVAALHGIVLAAIHVDGAVDMDVYGAFQLCAIGVLAGPVTVKLSHTYFNAPGRSLLFPWTTMILAGLLSLTVEFFRATPIPCPSSEFFYGEDACNLTCSADNGPTSPMRGGAQNNIYVIKAPDRLSFGTATLLAAACCIPAILSLLSMWNKILKINWKKRFGDGDSGEEDLNAHISGTNAATPAKMNKVNDRIRFYLSMVEIPVFGAAILAILILGERNFFSYGVAYMTEPIASIGQWAPIVGTGLAAVGSLYALLAADAEKPAEKPDTSTQHCECLHHCPSHDGNSVKTSPQHEHAETVEQASVESDRDVVGADLSRQETYQTYQTYQSSNAAATSVDIPRRPSRQLSHATSTGTTPGDGGAHHSHHQHHHHHHHHRMHRTGTESSTITSVPSPGTTHGGGSGPHHGQQRYSSPPPLAPLVDGGSRRKVAGALVYIGQKLGTPAPDAFDDSAFLMGPAADFPTVPGEEERNPDLPQIQLSYNRPRDADGHLTPVPGGSRGRARSRAGSFNGSFVSTVGGGMSPGAGGTSAAGLGIEGHAPEGDGGGVATMARRRDTVDGTGSGTSGAGGSSSRRPEEPMMVSGSRRRHTLEVPKSVYQYHHVSGHSSPAPRKDSSSTTPRPVGSGSSIAVDADHDADASHDPSSPAE